jgi:hypothetical protein
MSEVLLEANPQPIAKQPIIETAPYDRQETIAVTGFSLSTLIREEERGNLKPRRKGRRVYYMGSDLLAWLSREGGAS